jgi:hypothetical protein
MIDENVITGLPARMPLTFDAGLQCKVILDQKVSSIPGEILARKKSRTHTGLLPRLGMRCTLQQPEKNRAVFARAFLADVSELFENSRQRAAKKRRRIH